jgi:hypothetical protein
VDVAGNPIMTWELVERQVPATYRNDPLYKALKERWTKLDEDLVIRKEAIEQGAAGPITVEDVWRDRQAADLSAKYETNILKEKGPKAVAAETEAGVFRDILAEAAPEGTRASRRIAVAKDIEKFPEPRCLDDTARLPAQSWPPQGFSVISTPLPRKHLVVPYVQGIML